MSALVVAGDVSGSCTLQAPSAAGSTVLTLPVIAADTLAGIAATQTLTNKTLVAPALGTPASGVLTNCTGVPASALPAGSVLQVVNGTYATQTSNSTSTYITTGLTASITPRSTSSKILVFVNIVGTFKSNNFTTTGIGLRLYRGASSIVGFEDIAGYTGTTQSNAPGSCSTTYLDSPATISATTYTVYFASTLNTASVTVQNFLNTQANSTSTITLMEIQG
jgi:hypothetical protein